MMLNFIKFQLKAKRRSDIQIVNEIIKNILKLKNKKKVHTWIQQDTRLSYDVFEKFLNKMIKKKLIIKNTLVPTKKGIKFQKDAEKILKLETKLNKNL